MKKFFKNLTKKSPAKGPPLGGSQQLGAQSNASSSVCIGYDIREKDLGKLHKAAWTGDLAKVKQFAKKDSSPLDKENRTPLHLACAKGNTEVVQLLLEWKAKMNIGDNQAKTPLMKAVECEHDQSVENLLSERPDLDVKDMEGNTCLHMAVKNGNVKITDMLIKKGINLDVKNKDSLSPLHLAVMEQHDDVCRLLLNEGATIDITDANNRTPFMKACEEGIVNLVRLFLTFNVDTTKIDKSGWTADDFALIKGHHACSQLIANHNQNRTSASGTPRVGSLPPSLSTTPRDPDSAVLGAPAMDAEDDDSGDETSKISAVGAGGDDSWGDDTDISLAQEDRKNKDGSDEGEMLPDDEMGGLPRIDLSKLVKNLPDSDASESTGTPKPPSFPRVDEEDEEDRIGTPVKKHDSTKSLQSQTSAEDDWSMQDDLPSLKRNPSRVQFKKDEELSQIHNISMQSEESPSPIDPKLEGKAQSVPDKSSNSTEYIPSGLTENTGVSMFSPEKQRAFLEDLGITEPDELSDPDFSSEISPVEPAKATPLNGSVQESDWDSAALSDQQTTPRPGILKNWSKESQESDVIPEEKPDPVSQDEASDWGSSTVAEPTAVREDPPPPLPTSPVPKFQHFDEWDNDLEDAVLPTSNQSVSREVEAFLRLRQIESQDTEDEYDDDELSEKNNEFPLNIDLLHTAIGQSAKHFMGMDSSIDITPLQTPKDTPVHTDFQVDPRGTEQETDERDVTLPTTAQTDHKPSAQNNDMTPYSDEDDDSAWDSDGDLSEKIPPGKGFRQTDVNDQKLIASSDVEFESESISEWEIERQKQKDLQRLESDHNAVKLTEETDGAGINYEDFFRGGAVNTLDHKGDTPWHEFNNNGYEEAKREVMEFEQSNKKAERERLEAEESNKEEEIERVETAELERERMREEEANDAMEKQEEERQRQWEIEEEKKNNSLKAEAEKALEEERLQLSEFPSNDDFLVQTVSNTESMSEENASAIFLPDLDSESREELNRIEEEVKQEKLEEASIVEKEEKPSVSNTTQIPNQGNRQPNVYAPPPSLPPSVSTSHQLRQRLQVPPPSQMGVQSADFDDDDSNASDIYMPDSPQIERRDVTSMYPGLSGSGPFKFDAFEDDGLSYTSTEFERDEGLLGGPIPSALQNRDMLINLNVNDPRALLKIQDDTRETRRQLEQERSHRLILENKHKMITKERNDLQIKIESLIQQKSALDQDKLNLEAKIRNLEYNLMEEEEKSRNAEVLLNKTKDQLTRKEEQYTHEIEAKQKAELFLRNAELELKTSNNKIKELEADQLQLTRDIKYLKETRHLQEKINEEQAKMHQQQHQAKMKDLTQSSPVRESTSDERGGDLNDSLKVELYALQMESEKQRVRFKEENSLLIEENEELHKNIEEIKREIALHEDALMKAASDYSIQLNKAKADILALAESLEKEKVDKEKVEAKLESTVNHLSSTVQQMDKATLARNEIERELQHEKAQYQKLMDQKCRELAALQEDNQQITEYLKAADNKVNSVENDLHVSQTSLLERTNHLQQSKQELDKLKTSHESANKKHMELNYKQQTKIETLQEKLSQSQHEILRLKQQVDNIKNAGSHDDAHDKFNTMIMNLRSESERLKTSLEERNASLSESATRLREEMRNSENRRSTLEADMKRLNQDHNDVIKKLSHTEATLEMAQKIKDQVEGEREQLKAEVHKLQQKYEDSHEKCIEAQARAAEVVDRMERAEQNSLYSSQQLANTSANMHAFSKCKEDLGEIRQKLEIENTRLDAELKHEKQRADMLFQDLQDSQKVRSSLEALCSNLKTTSVHLEEKLGPSSEDECEGMEDEETAHRCTYEQEAQESKGLWEHEVLSRSKLGLRIAQLEKQKQQFSVQLDEEKKKVRRVAEIKRNSESKLESEKEKNQQLQQEIVSLKMHLKSAKKKLKEPDGFDPRLSSTLCSEFDKERITMEETLNSTKRQIADLQRQLEKEVKSKEKLKIVHQKLKQEKAKMYELKQRIANQPNWLYENVNIGGGGSGGGGGVMSSGGGGGFVSGGFSTSDGELLRQELEAKFRMELNRKLDEVNRYLEEQARASDKLNDSRTDNEMKIMNEKKRLQNEMMDLNMKYQKSLAEFSTVESEATRYRKLYDAEMKWRMRLSEQLQLTAEKAVDYKSKLAVQRHRNKMSSSLNFSNLTNGPSLEASRHYSGMADILSNKIQADLDRSIAKHLEAAPHNDTTPVIQSTDWNTSYARASADYSDLLKRKFCV